MVRRAPDAMALVKQFADGVAGQTDAILRGEQGRDRHGKRYGAAFDKLRAMGNPGRDALATLFTHERPDVRVMAAAHLLRHRTAEAIAVLQEAARGEGLASFGAQQALERWEEGTWALDPPDDPEPSAG